MPRELCQEKKLKEKGILSRCVECSAQDGCHDAIALQIIQLRKKPEDGKVQLMRSCNRFQPFSGAFSRGERSLAAPLTEAGVTDLCETCPFEEKNGCDHRKRLDTQIHSARRDGRQIDLIVIACTTLQRTESGAECKKLWQIAEPAGK